MSSDISTAKVTIILYTLTCLFLHLHSITLTCLPCRYDIFCLHAQSQLWNFETVSISYRVAEHQYILHTVRCRKPHLIRCTFQCNRTHGGLSVRLACYQFFSFTGKVQHGCATIQYIISESITLAVIKCLCGVPLGSYLHSPRSPQSIIG